MCTTSTPYTWASTTTTTTTTALISCHNSLSPSILSISIPSQRPFCCALKTGSHESSGHDLFRKRVISPSSLHDNYDYDDDDNGYRDNQGRKRFGFDSDGEEETRVNWEDRILEETVPLAGFVRMILHSGEYKSGDRLSPEHERAILEKVLPYHPDYEKKIGCGVASINIGYHPTFEDSRCLFIVRKDGELVDFSYWKCIKGFIRKNYPLYAETFILKHFRRRRRFD